ncbi:transcription-repair coupling factor [Paratissierella segnis]|uniref:Transcription-repair-coupling factor n=1 Tax=Paratissierella segnis TaxID=2763679 RepID=A0A926EWW6_9FIRM|nr:transcription-repair coupling factor [Paratissierella segnis]MBC8587929.1 transcription-repair coupling factor [Paratissierella segnis]
MVNFLIDPLKNLDSYKNLINDVERNKSPIATYGIIDENLGHFTYALNEHLGRQLLIITYDEVRSRDIYDDIRNLTGNIELFPKKEILFYDVDAFSSESTHQRLTVLSRLMDNEDLIIVTSLDALLDKVLDKDIVSKYTITLEYGKQLDLQKLMIALIDGGYERVPMIEGIGQFSVRGGIIDFFPPNSKDPYRVELFDDEIDSIRAFDINTQRSLNVVNKVKIPPVKEILIVDEFKNGIINGLEKDLKKSKDNHEKFEHYLELLKEGEFIPNRDLLIPYISDEYMGSIISYLKTNALIFIDEPKRVDERSRNIKIDFNQKYTDLFESKEVLSAHININYDYRDLLPIIKEMVCITNSALIKGDSNFNPKAIYNFPSKSVPSYQSKMELLKEDLKDYKYRGYKIIIQAGSEERGKRLKKSLIDMNIESSFVEDTNAEIKSGQVFITPGTLKSGFEYSTLKFMVIGDKEVFGVGKKKRKAKKEQKQSALALSDLSIGDLVVHENHGIGRYEGIEQLNIQGIKKDYLKIQYGGQDKLYLPIDQMNLIQKYISSDNAKPKLSKLSSTEWKKTKERAKKAVEDMAIDLLNLYAKRESMKGYSFNPDTVWQKQFEDLFPYEETEGQLITADEIKKDMEKEKPMDRLLCGDVGYGKTEVALRAAFKALMDNKQVAILVPTTILAQQHYNTIMERFGSFPIRVALLSRFRSSAEQKLSIGEIKKGSIDIVVGTHRLLSKDVVFKDLGLLIIDEEQRFGVKHKETLKKLKANVDVLTLTATPIPRTLHMSLAGIRDMSVIEEPPEERYPIQTYVVEFNEEIIRDAILKEIARDGQVYFVYNRVETIDRIASRLRALVPEASFVVAHGQMAERQLERVMMDFLNKKQDVLVCTTIIETGLDIPNVNTIIVYDADKMGLSQLYQLRGRVGRTNRLAYGYFVYEKDKVLTEIAEKRLRAIKEFTEFGSGFKIAMRDLEIRGAGNLIGIEQHGHIESIGYDLYMKFLSETIRTLKGEKVAETIETSIDIKVDGFIPKKFIEDEEQKIEIYKKIASIENLDDYGELLDELIDRFGDIPSGVKNLMDISYIKSIANKNNIKNISQTERYIKIDFVSTENLSLKLIHFLSTNYGDKISFDLSNSPSIKYHVKKNPLENLKQLIEKIDSFTKNKNNI